jgi:hypothetical protein
MTHRTNARHTTTNRPHIGRDLPRFRLYSADDANKYERKAAAGQTDPEYAAAFYAARSALLRAGFCSYVDRIWRRPADDLCAYLVQREAGVAVVSFRPGDGLVISPDRIGAW